MSDRYSTKSILLRAARLDSEDRRQFLESACGKDFLRIAKISAWLDRGDDLQKSPLDVVIEQIHSISQSREEAETDTSGADSRSDRELSLQEHCGRWIGNYQLIELLGQGGMGAVYLARQSSPIHRDVALKLTNLGSSSRQLLAHFEAERQTLELMNHPGITSVLDAGTTDWGVPYFVMELVSGQPITDYCSDRALSLPQRVRLFIDVCLAVQHAHHKGIVHRDLKPSNVLVTCQDEKPAVKVIDFGIARAVDRATDKSTDGNRLFLITGTPLYMSPEQTVLSGEAADTRSDVYSLGVLLYELLAGATPFDADRFRELGGEELCRAIQEESPPRPSSRHGEPRSSDARQLRFELDWIVMKAIQKQPADRYPTASALADDLQRYLDGKLVLAHPSDWRYRSIKWLTAHKVAFASAIAIASCMLLATAISLYSARDARRARDASQALLFAADMKIASEALRDANIRPARERLERHIPRSGEIDRRNFAWYYLWNQLNPETQTIQTDDHLFEIRFSPDGELFATGHESGEVLVWRVGSEEPIYRLEKHPDIVRCIAFSPDGTRLATGSDDGEMRLWTLGQTTPTASWLAHSDDILGIAWIDEDRFATAGDHEVKIWSASGLDVGNSRLQTDSKEPQLNVPMPAVYPTQIIGPFPDLVYSMAVSPNGKELAVASGNVAAGGRGLISFWDIQSGREISRKSVDAKPISLDYHPAGKLLAVGTQDGYIYTIQPDSSGGQFSTRIDAAQHSANVYRVSFSTDGSRMVSASKDATLRVWNTEDWTCEQTVQSHLRRVYAAEFCPGNLMFASASADGSIRFFDSVKNAFQRTSLPMPLAEKQSETASSYELIAKRTPENARYLNKHGWFLLSGNNWSNGFYCTQTRRYERIPFPATHSFEISANERQLVASVRDGIVFGAGLTKQRLEQSRLPPMDVNGDGIEDRVGGFGNDGRLVWQPRLSKDEPNYEPPRLYGHKPPPVWYRLATPKSDDWHELYSFDQAMGYLKREQIAAGKVIEVEILCSRLQKNVLWQMTELAEGRQPTHIVALPGRGAVYVIPEDRNEQRIEFQSGVNGINAVYGFSTLGTAEIDCVVVADDSRRIHLFCKLLPDADGNQANLQADFRRVQEIQSPFEIWELDVTKTATGQIALHTAGPDGICSYAFLDNLLVDLPIQSQEMEGSEWAQPLIQDIVSVEMQSRQIVGSFRSPEHHVWALAVSDDGKLIATAGDGDYIRLWNSDGLLVGSFDVPRNAKYSMAFTANAQRLCVGVGDDVYIYDVPRQSLLHRCIGHENSVGSLAISPNQDILATVSHDLTVRLWSISTGQPLAVLVGHMAIPTSIAFDHEGRLVASADRSGIVKLWDIQTGGELLELRDFKFRSKSLAFDTPTSLSILGWTEDVGSNPNLQIGRWSITLDDK